MGLQKCALGVLISSGGLFCFEFLLIKEAGFLQTLQTRGGFKKRPMIPKQKRLNYSTQDPFHAKGITQSAKMEVNYLMTWDFLPNNGTQ